MSRKKRDKIDKSGIDLMQPIDITIFGSENDPCFGKLNDPANSICQRCGDSEICQIVQSQKLHATREKQSKTTKFKDEEEPFLELRTMERFIVDTLKGENPMRFGKLKKLAIRYFSTMDKTTPEKITEVLMKYLSKTDKVKKIKKQEKRYLKLI